MKKSHSTSLPVLIAVGLVMAFSASAQARKKKHFTESGKLLEMQDVPCGSRQKGLVGLGGIFASAGVTDVNAKDKLCQEYVLRTADEELRIRPVDEKHLQLLPIGAEAEFQIKKDRVLLSVPEGDGKVREYKVVAMKPLDRADSGAPVSASAAALRDDSQPAVGTWTATLHQNSAPGSDVDLARAVPSADRKEYQGAPDPSAEYHLAMALQQKGDIDGAVAGFRKVIEANPNDARAHAALAGALERRGDSAGALKEYGLALKLDPDDPAIRANYDRLVQTTGGDAGTSSGQ